MLNKELNLHFDFRSPRNSDPTKKKLFEKKRFFPPRSTPFARPLQVSDPEGVTAPVFGEGANWLALKLANTYRII